MAQIIEDAETRRSVSLGNPYRRNPSAPPVLFQALSLSYRNRRGSNLGSSTNRLRMVDEEMEMEMEMMMAPQQPGVHLLGFTTSAVQVAYCVPALLLMGLCIVFSLHMLIGESERVILPQLVALADEPSAWRAFRLLLSIPGELVIVQSCAFLVTISLGMVIDIWTEGTWLETFPGIPRVVQVVLFNTLVVIVPYGALAFCSFSGLEAASKMYRVAGLASSATLLAIYGALFLWSESNLIFAMLGGRGQWDSKLCALFSLRACQRYGWLARAIHRASSFGGLCWRKKGKKQQQQNEQQDEARDDAEGGDSSSRNEVKASSLCLCGREKGKKNTEEQEDEARDAEGGDSRRNEGQPGTTVSGSSCCLGLVQLRHPWTAESIRAALPNETDLVPNGDGDSASECNEAGLANDFVPEARVALLLGLLALAAIGCVVYYQASVYAAVVFLFMVGTLGAPLTNQLVKLYVYRRRASSASDPPEVPEEAPLEAIPSTRLQAVCFFTELLFVYVVPFALGTWLYMDMGANMAAISLFLAVACLLTFFQAFFNSEKVIPWEGPSAVAEISKDPMLVSRAVISKSRIFNRSFHAGVCFVLWVVFATLLLVNSMAAFGDPQLKGPTETWTFADQNAPEDTISTMPGASSVSAAAAAVPTHEVCSVTGGVPELSVLDYAMMSQFAYFPEEDTAVIDAQLKEYFGVHYGALQLVDMKDGASGRFIAFEVPWANALIVAARGTATWRDLLANLNMYTESVLVLHLVAPFWPLTALYSSIFPEVIAVLAGLFTSGQWFSLDSMVLRPDIALEDFTRQLMAERVSSHPGEKTVLTGHSLGGGAAMLASARLGISSVAFNAPNAHIAHKRFSTHAADLDLWTTNVHLSRDPISMIDQSPVRSLAVQCSAPGDPLGVTPACHLVFQVACDLQRTCGPAPGRRQLMGC